MESFSSSFRYVWFWVHSHKMPIWWSLPGSHGSLLHSWIYLNDLTYFFCEQKKNDIRKWSVGLRIKNNSCSSGGLEIPLSSRKSQPSLTLVPRTLMPFACLWWLQAYEWHIFKITYTHKMKINKKECFQTWWPMQRYMSIVKEVIYPKIQAWP